MALILVVDDAPDLRFMLRRVLELAGYDVVEASDGAAAIRCVAESAPDLVVTDMMMPVMDGPELVRRLRADATTAHLPILAVSGDGQLAEGADALVRKPFTGHEVVDLAKKLIVNGRAPA